MHFHMRLLALPDVYFVRRELSDHFSDFDILLHPHGAWINGGKLHGHQARLDEWELNK